MLHVASSLNSVQSIFPVLGMGTGGNEVLINGETFIATSSMKCRFGSNIVSASFVSSTQLRCIAPAGVTGSVGVEVSLDGTSWTTNGIQYRYYTCAGTPYCSDHGSCNTDNSCTCYPGWFGTACDVECPGGSSLPCSNHTLSGTCTSTGTCSCKPGWFGTSCASECPGGATNICNGHGQCRTDGGCLCTLGWVVCVHYIRASHRGIFCLTEMDTNDRVLHAKSMVRVMRVGIYVNVVLVIGEICVPISVLVVKLIHAHHMVPVRLLMVSIPFPSRSRSDLCFTSAIGRLPELIAGKCTCNRGYYGELCDQTCRGGSDHPCNDHGHDGTCNSDGTCSCNVGYWGDTCQGRCPGVGTSTGICHGHGTCSSSGVCSCEWGWVCSNILLTSSSMSNCWIICWVGETRRDE
jgi:hypothetical protein